MNNNYLNLDLSLFGEGGEGAAPKAAAPSAGSETSAPAAKAAPEAPDYEAAVTKRCDQMVESWKSQMAETGRYYPEFNMVKAMNDPKFRKLILNNVDVRTAYEVTNRDVIYPRIMESTARSIASKMMNHLASNQSRPTENGTQSNSAAMVKRDPAKMTRAERQEIVRRVQKGEIISF